jgi:hypothetical protein
MPVIPAIGEAEVEGVWHQSSPCQHASPCLKNKLKQKGLEAWINGNRVRTTETYKTYKYYAPDKETRNA